VEAIVAAKGREADKPLQVIFPTVAALAEATAPSPCLAAAFQRLLPGGITLVIPYPSGFRWPPPGRGRDGRHTLGVRVPAWPAAARLLAGLNGPLVASSANESGAQAARSLDEVPAGLRAACDLLLDAGQLAGTASTVIDVSDYEEHGVWCIVRSGALPEAAAAAALGPSKGTGSVAGLRPGRGGGS
jgi:L-threonylcarbamoyladenylate synthase